MNLNLDSYVKIYSSIDSKSCKDITEIISKNSWEKHAFYDPLKNEIEHRSGNQELDVSYSLNESVNDFLMKHVWNSFFKYVEELEFPWWNGWSAFSNIRFNRYEENRVMAEHCDHIHTLFDGKNKGIPIMTALGLLNDDFEGGELVMFQDRVIKMKPGDIAVFPSNFLYPHRVDAIKKGTRYSFVSWAW